MNIDWSSFLGGVWVGILLLTAADRIGRWAGQRAASLEHMQSRNDDLRGSTK